MIEPTLRERIAQTISEMTLKIMMGEGNSINYIDQILNLIKEELDGLTVIGDEEIYNIRPNKVEYKQLDADAENYHIKEFKGAYWNEKKRELVDRKIAQAQLSHTTKELKEKLTQ